MLSYIAFAVSGKLVVFLIQKFPLFTWIGKKWKTFGQLVECDLCLGVWVYVIINLLEFRLTFYSADSNLFGEVLTGFAMSFLMHLLSIGWQAKFGIIVVGKE